MTPNLEMFLAINVGTVLVCWKALQTLSYLATHEPRLILPRRPRPAPRRIEPLIDSAGWSNGIAVEYRDDTSEAAG